MADNKRTMPEIRDRLKEIAAETDNEELLGLAEELRRSAPFRRSPPRSAVFTPEMAEDIRAYARKNPQASQQEIASYFGVNSGRVSEAVNNRTRFEN